MKSSVFKRLAAATMVLWIVLGVMASPGQAAPRPAAMATVIDDTALAGVTGGNGACVFIDGVAAGLFVASWFGCGPCIFASGVATLAGWACGTWL